MAVAASYLPLMRLSSRMEIAGGSLVDFPVKSDESQLPK